MGVSIDVLPRTLSELHNKFDIIQQAKGSSVPPPSEEILLLSELVMAVGSTKFNSEKEKIRVFKLLERFPNVRGSPVVEKCMELLSLFVGTT